jgi:hypothetical protein
MLPGLTLWVFAAISCDAVVAGSIFVSGHDPDFHAFAGSNAAGARNLINLSLDFVRGGNTAPILFLESNTLNVGLGDHVDSESGLIASGYSAGTTPGSHYVKVNSVQFAGVDLSLYSAIFVPSDHGGTLTGDDLLALNARAGDILAYLNAGGGLVAFAEDGFRIGPAATNFGFLPFLVSAAAASQGESGFTLTPAGTALGLVSSDINGNFSHNIFTSTGGMDVIDRDASERIVSLAYSGLVGVSGVVPEPATIVSFGLGFLCLIAYRRRRFGANAPRRGRNL